MARTGLRLITSNRVEALAEQLAAELSTPPADPLAQEWVAVPNPGLGRWLTQILADERGLSMNLRFPFLEEVVESLLFPQTASEHRLLPHQRIPLTWRIFNHLSEFDPASLPPPLDTYLQGEHRLKVWQIANQSARAFRDYLLQRPQLLAQWTEQPNRGDWQSVLWEQLAQAWGQQPGLKGYLEALMGGSSVEENSRTLPMRVHCFGVSVLPPLYLRTLQSLAECREVLLYTPLLTAGFWDLQSPRSRRKADEDPEAEAQSNPLLASCGRVGQDFFRTLLDTDIQAQAGDEHFIEPGRGTVLKALQQDILDLADPRTDPQAQEEPCPSLTLCKAHSPLREVQGLRDYLLRSFEALPGLKPRDILVLCPDISRYAPLIRSVFGISEPGIPALPFSIADQPERSQSPLVDAFFSLLELSTQPFNARILYDLLSQPWMRQRFQLDDASLERLAIWLTEARIRRGLDPEDPTRKDSLETPSTWAEGLDRLTLSWATGLEPQASWQGVTPSVQMGSSEAELLDKFCGVFDLVLETLKSCTTPKPQGKWASVFAAAVERLFSDALPGNQSLHERAALLQGLEHFSQLASQGNAVMDQRTALQALRPLIPSTSPSGGFLNGQITFCELRPLRNVPARIICLLGMDDGAFPRPDQRPAFHRIQKARRQPGDSFNDELDRFLFLETLLSARERLYLSYCGLSQEEDGERPPSIVLSELLDTLRAGYPGALKAGVNDLSLPMHPFMAGNFGDPALKSYSKAYARLAQLLRQPKAQEAENRQTALPEVRPPEPLSLGRLRQFYKHPTAFFLEQRVGVDLRERFTLIEEEDSLKMNPLERYLLRRDLLQALDAEQDPAIIFSNAQAEGRLPPGEAGLRIFEGVETEASTWLNKKLKLTANAEQEELTVHLRLEDRDFADALGPCYGGQLLIEEVGKCNPLREFTAWLSHLLAHAAGHQALTTHLLTVDRVISLEPIGQETARKRLIAVTRWLERALVEPLPLTPGTVRDVYERSHKNWNRKKPSEKTEAGIFQKEAQGDVALELCFGPWPTYNQKLHQQAAADLWTGYAECMRKEGS